MVSLAIESMEMVDQCARARRRRCGRLGRLLCAEKITDLAVAKCLSSKKTSTKRKAGPTPCGSVAKFLRLNSPSTGTTNTTATTTTAKSS